MGVLFPDLACGFIGMDILLTSALAKLTCHTGAALLCELCSGLPETPNMW